MLRYFIILLSTIVFVCAGGPNLINIQAEEYRHHEAHEHGAARLNVALEGNDIYIELISPAANIVGFEHRPRGEAQKAAVKKAIETLKTGNALFALSPDAGGRLASSTVFTDITGDSDHKSGDAHGHERSESSKENEEDKHSQHENHESEKHESHSEFKAEYHFVCKNPDRLSEIGVNLFHVFPGIEHIEVQLLTGTGQTALELTPKKKKITF